MFKVSLFIEKHTFQFILNVYFNKLYTFKMQRLALCLISYLIVQDLVGSLAAHWGTGSSVCLLTDAPSQCSSFCLAALHPFFKCSDKLDRIGGVLKNTITREDFEAKLDLKLKTIKSEILGELQLLLKKQDVKLEAFLSKVEKKQEIIPPRFERIGPTFFYIEESANIQYYEAESTCEKKGGHIMSFEYKTDVETIGANLKNDSYVWAGRGFYRMRHGERDLSVCFLLNNGRVFLDKCQKKAGFVCHLQNAV